MHACQSHCLSVLSVSFFVRRRLRCVHAPCKCVIPPHVMLQAFSITSVLSYRTFVSVVFAEIRRFRRRQEKAITRSGE